MHVVSGHHAQGSKKRQNQQASRNIPLNAFHRFLAGCFTQSLTKQLVKKGEREEAEYAWGEHRKRKTSKMSRQTARKTKRHLTKKFTGDLPTIITASCLTPVHCPCTGHNHTTIITNERIDERY